MNFSRVCWLVPLLLTANATAGQKIQSYYLTSSSNSSTLPRYRSPGEGCIGLLRGDMRAQQKAHSGFKWRYRLTGVSEDDGFSEYGCNGAVDEFVSGAWKPIDSFGPGTAAVFGFSSTAVTCSLSGYKDAETGQCGPPKKTDGDAMIADAVDAASGNAHQIETDYVGAGAFPLHFERTYDSNRSWLNNPVPLGIAWTHTYLASIYFMPAAGSNTITQAVAYRPNGSILRFNLIAGVWTADADVPERLSATIDANNIPTATLTNTDDSVEQYDGIGHLISINNREGLTQTLSYVTATGTYANDVQKVTDPQGHTLSFGYNASGQLASVTDGNGGVIQYGYDSVNGNLTSVVYPDVGSTTKTRNYLYNEAGQVAVSWPHALTGISEEISTGNFHRLASWGYDSEGRGVLSVHGPYATGTIDKTTLLFNGDGTTTFTDALGQIRNYTFTVKYQVAHPAVLDTACDGCQARDKTRGYDTNGYANASTDFNDDRATYAFAALDSHSHPRGLGTQRVEGIPPASNPTDTSAERIINTTWDPNFRVPAMRNLLDSTGTNVQIENWIYNSRGQALFHCVADPNVAGASGYTCGSLTNAPVGVRQWAWTYCESGGGCPLVGQLLTSKGPRTDIGTDVTTYAYYPNDEGTCAAAPTTCPYRKGDLQTVMDAAGHITAYASYDGDGRPTRIIDANGVPTDLSYHSRGWLLQRAVRANATGTSTSDRITAYAYDGAGDVTQVTQPAGDYMIYGYDIAHRLTDVTDRLGNTMHYVLDAAGNRTEEDSIGHGGSTARKVLRDYDVLGRLHDQKNAVDGSLAMTYQYDGNGNVQQTTDGNSHVTINTYDPRNRLVKTDQAADIPVQEAFTNYTYDALDRLTGVQDPQGLPTTYGFDALGNQTQLSSPDTGLTTYGQDAAGNRTSQSDQRPVTTSYTYDALNRLTGITYPTSSLNVTYRYDTIESACPLADQFPMGRLTFFSDGSGSTQFCYDRYGELAIKSQTITGASTPYNVIYSYTKDGLPNKVTEPRQTQIKYSRDAAARIVNVSYRLKDQTADTQVVRNVGYEPFGPVTAYTYDNGSGHTRTLTRTYDTDYVIQKVRDQTADGLNLSYDRDAVSNLTRVTDIDTGNGNKLIYDALNRLTQVNKLNDHPLLTYSYDSTGNRKTKQSLTYTYDINSHHLINDGVSDRQYDPIGDTTQIGIDTNRLNFNYNDLGRMDQAKRGGNQIKKYAYNARGERVRKSHDGFPNEVMRTVYDESGHVLGDFDSADNILDEYIWMDDLPVGVLSGATPTLSLIEPDHLGTPRTAIDPATDLVAWQWPIVNDPFGETQPVNLNGSTITLNLRFPGQQYDAESGVSYNYFRDYDSGTGRYLESDPLGLEGGIATYPYTGNSPLDSTDPKGLKSSKANPASHRLQ